MALQLIDLINSSDHLLDKSGIEAPRQNVERMLERILGISRIDLYLSPKREISEEEEAKFKELLDRRLANEPLQYILGETEFYGLPFKCDKRALIPRPETEFVVHSALKHIAGRRGLDILDLGCGSGVIVIATSANSPDNKFYASDISSDSVALAQNNAVLNKIDDKIVFRSGNMYAPWKADERRFDLILSNPPYIKEGEFELLHEQVRRFEPKRALLAGPEGLDFIERLRDEAPAILKPEGFLIFEVGMGQAEIVRRNIEDNASLEHVETVVDYRGVERVLVLRRT